MFDLMEQFIIFLMDGFYQSLEDNLKQWNTNFLKAVAEGNQTNRDTALKYLQNYRELMNDLRDENMDIKDFVGLLAEKYGFVRAD